MKNYSKIVSICKKQRKLIYTLTKIDNMFSFEDVVVEIYIKACEKNVNIENITHSFVEYTVKDLIKKSLRKKRNRNNIITNKEINIDNFRDTSHKDCICALFEDYKLIDYLSAEEYDIISLYYIYGYTHLEISKMKKINIQTVGNILKRCINKIKKEME